MVDILEEVKRASQKSILFTPHAIEQMTSPERMISADDVMLAISNGEVIEDYPDDRRGHSCLLLGTGEKGRTLHIVCAPKPDHLTIVTTYAPDLLFWHQGFRKRRLV